MEAIEKLGKSFWELLAGRGEEDHSDQKDADNVAKSKAGDPKSRRSRRDIADTGSRTRAKSQHHKKRPKMRPSQQERLATGSKPMPSRNALKSARQKMAQKKSSHDEDELVALRMHLKDMEEEKKARIDEQLALHMMHEEEEERRRLRARLKDMERNDAQFAQRLAESMRRNQLEEEAKERKLRREEKDARVARRLARAERERERRDQQYEQHLDLHLSEEEQLMIAQARSAAQMEVLRKRIRVPPEGLGAFLEPYRHHSRLMSRVQRFADNGMARGVMQVGDIVQVADGPTIISDHDAVLRYLAGHRNQEIEFRLLRGAATDIPVGGHDVHDDVVDEEEALRVAQAMSMRELGDGAQFEDDTEIVFGYDTGSAVPGATVINIDDMDYDQLLELGEQLGQVKSQAAKAEDVQNLPSKILSQADVDAKKDDDDECTICLSEWVESEEVRTLPCFHQFHAPCIDYWLTKSKKCPMCKNSIDGS